MSRAPRPLFLARQSYRRRRAVDASRVLPLAGGFLLCFPVLWSRPAPADAVRPGLAEQGLYVFAVWLGLVAVAAVVAWRLRGHDMAAHQPRSLRAPGDGDPAAGRPEHP